MKQRKHDQKGLKYATWVLASVIALMPFSAALTVWAGSNIGQYRLIQLWKEFLLIWVFVYLLVKLWNSRVKPLIKLKQPMIVLIILYAALTLSYGVFAYFSGRVDIDALIFSLITNLRFLLIFACAFLLATELPNWWNNRVEAIVLVPAAIVVGFAIFQVTILPFNFLENFGYSKFTILPYQFVDNNPEFLRAQSTLRGANPLGAYILMIISLTATWFLVSKKQKQRIKFLVMVGLSFMTLFYTYSRSAYLGCALALIVLAGWYIYTHPNYKVFVTHYFVLIFLIFGITATGLFLLAKQNDTVQNIIFHTRDGSTSPVSSNEQRLDHLSDAAEDIVREPLGQGPGTAGPASVQNDKQPGRISENYFLQIGQEIGVIGLLLFIGINVLVVKYLWVLRQNPLAAGLLASFLGITLVNMVSHAWTDDTLALIWWGLAGVAISPVILKRNTRI